MMSPFASAASAVGIPVSSKKASPREGDSQPLLGKDTSDAGSTTGFLSFGGPSGGGKSRKYKADEARVAMRAQMAALLFPDSTVGGGQREKELLALEQEVMAKAPPALQEWWAKEPESDPAATIEVGLTSPSDAPLPSAAIKLQARARGLQTRRRLSKKEPHAAYMGDKDSKPAAPPAWLVALKAKAAASSPVELAGYGAAGLGALVLILALLWFGRGVVLWILGFVFSIVWHVLLYIVLLLVALYAWMRLPSFLGYILSEVLTKVVFYDGLAMGIKTVRARIWFTYGPPTLWVDVHADSFSLGNARHIGARHPNMVEADNTQVLLNVDLTFLYRLYQDKFSLASLKEQPIMVKIKTLIISDILFNMMLGDTGIFNLYAIATTVNEGEIRSAMPKNVPMSNVVRVKILAARKLQALPNLMPRVVVSIRKNKVSTGVGTRAMGAERQEEYHFHGAEIMLPTPHAECVLVVRVYNDNVSFGTSPKLLGQWFMTLKWLHQAPDHCKHAKGKLTKTGDGGIAGTFLLTDAKLHGSAVRHMGPHDLGDGFMGELDMAIQWTHTDRLEPSFADEPHKLIHKEPMSAIDQLGSTGEDDTLRFGNWAELKATLHNLPIRFDIDHFVLRRLKIEMSDLFTGVGVGQGDGENVVNVKELSLKLGVVSMYGFFEKLGLEVVKTVSFDLRALGGATSEIFSGLSTNLGKQFRGIFSVLPGVTKKEESAATRMQAQVRGMKVRRASKTKKGA